MSPMGRQPVPLERGRAAGMLTGLILFGVGFLAAAVVGLAGHGGGPAYLASVGVGFFGVGCVAFFLNRGTVPLPEAPIWSRIGLTKLAVALDLPPLAVMGVVYGLIGAGVLGNIIIPLSQR